MAKVYPPTKVGARANALRPSLAGEGANLGSREKVGTSNGAKRTTSYKTGGSMPNNGAGGMGSKFEKDAAYKATRAAKTARKMKTAARAARATTGVTKAATNLARASRGANALGAGMMAFQAGRDLHNYVDRKAAREEFKKGTQQPAKDSISRKVSQGTAKRLGI